MADKAYYRKRLVDLRQKKKDVQAKKKSSNAYFMALIKGASSSSTKANYRKSKIDAAERYDKEIQSIQRDIDNTTAAMHRC